MTNLFTLPWRKPFTIVFHSDAVWRWVTRACTTDREGFNRCARKLFKHTRPDNRVTFVIFHARRPQQIRHDAISPPRASLFSCFLSTQLNFSSRVPEKKTRTRSNLDTFTTIDVWFLIVRFSPFPPSPRFPSPPEKEIFDPLNFFGFLFSEVSVYG